MRGYPSTAESSILSSLISDLQSSDSDFEIKTFLVSDLGVSQPLHISFSRPIGFLKDQKDDFLEDLKRAISRSRIRS